MEQDEGERRLEEEVRLGRKAHQAQSTDDEEDEDEDEDEDNIVDAEGWTKPDVDAIVSIRQTELYQLMKPLMIYLELFGLIHVRASKECVGHRLRPVRKSDDRRRKFVLRCLHLVRSLWDAGPPLVIVTTAVYLLVFAFEVGAHLPWVELSGLNMELFTLGFTVQCLTSLVLMYVHCESGLMLRLFRSYSLLAKDNKVQKARLDGIVARYSKLVLLSCLVMNVYICLTVQMFLHYSSTGQVDIGCFGRITMSVLARKPLYYYTEFVGVVFITPPFTLMAGLLCIMCTIVRYSYEFVNAELGDRVLSEEDRCASDSRYGSDVDVSQSFAKHRHITRMVDMVSQLFGPYLITFLLVNLAMSCFLAYVVIFSCRSNLMAGIIQLGWILSAAIVGFFFFFRAIQLHNRAKKGWEHLSAIPMSHISSKHGIELTVFLKSVSSRRSIGVSACGFFTITQKFFIWTLSSFLSYFVVLIKFSPPIDFCALSTSTGCSSVSPPTAN